MNEENPQRKALGPTSIQTGNRHNPTAISLLDSQSDACGGNSYISSLPPLVRPSITEVIDEHTLNGTTREEVKLGGRRLHTLLSGHVMSFFVWWLRLNRLEQHNIAFDDVRAA